MKLYSAALSPNCLRVNALVLELGIELEVIDVDIFRGGSRTELLTVNTNGKVPALVDGEFTLWESRAIMGHLARKRPQRGLQPSDPQMRALCDQWLFWQAIHLGPAMQKVAFERVMKSRFGMGDPDVTLIESQMRDVGRHLGVLDGALSEPDWIVGELSIADFALASTFMYREAAEISLDAVPNVEAWIERMESRDSWRDAAAPLLAAVLG